MKTALKLALLAVMVTLALTAAWGALGAIYQAKSGRARYMLREKDGLVAVYKSGENRPLRMTGIETTLLRRADRAMLEKGIPAEDLSEVLTLLEDLGS